MPQVQVMDVTANDPFEGMISKARGELKAVLAQTEAARATLAALQNTLAATQAQVTDQQAKLASLQQSVRDADTQAAKIIADARTQAGVTTARAAKEAKQLLDDATARVAVAARLLTSGTTEGTA